MRMATLILTAVAATLLTASARAQDGDNLARKKVKELQKERIAALKEVADVTQELFKLGRASSESVAEAMLLAFEAELDAAENESDRITIHKNIVNVLNKYEKVVGTEVETGRRMHTAVLKVRARRLKAEIDLERAKARQPAVERNRIGVTSPKAKDVTVTEKYVCQVHAHRHIKIRSLQNGYLEAIPVKEGQTVKQGDVLFKVLPTLYKARWEAELAEVRLAELDFMLTARMAKNKGVVSANEVALSEAKLKRAQAKAKLAEAEFRFTMITAPFDGIIDRLHEQRGSLVNERDVLTTLSDNSVMWVYFNVPEARYLEYMRVRDKQKDEKVELVLARGYKFKQTGKIGAIEAQFNNETGSIPFRADFPNPDRLLRHGMTGQVLIHRTLTGAIVIPERATFEIADKRYVYVVDKDNVAHQREIVVLHEMDGIFVVRGVGVDDRIIFDGIRHVRDGAKVEYDYHPPDQVLGQVTGTR